MSRPRPAWWRDVKDAIRRYPEMKKAMQDQVPTAATARYGPQTPHSGVGRPLEDKAIKRLSDGDAQDYEAINAAIHETAKMENGKTRLTIIDLVYWKRSHSIQGAGMKTGYSKRQADRFIREFILLVAFYQGRITREETRRRY